MIVTMPRLPKAPPRRRVPLGRVVVAAAMVAAFVALYPAASPGDTASFANPTPMGSGQ